jgi:multiple sugar transport system permease protein
MAVIQERRRRMVREGQLVVLRYLVLFVLGISFILPFYWMVSTSFKLPGQAYLFPPQWIPNPFTIENYRAVWSGYVPFGLFYRNTAIVVFFSLLGTLLSSTLVAYSFARLQWWGKNAWFIVLLGTMMLPYHVVMIPHYILFRNLGWLDSFLPLTVPHFFGNAFYIFLLRQFFLTIPSDLEDAARVDGCSALRIYWQIILPLAKPVLVTVGLFTFVANWNDFLGPLLYLESMEKMTVSVGLAMFQGTYTTNWPNLTAASTLATIPILLVFFLAQRYFVQGIVMTGMKA